MSGVFLRSTTSDTHVGVANDTPGEWVFGVRVEFRKLKMSLSQSFPHVTILMRFRYGDHDVC